jgi:hypothetical protein
MRTEHAIEFINNQLCFIPGWEISAESYEKRFQGMLLCHYKFPAQNSNQNLAPTYEQEIPGKNHVTLKLEVGDARTFMEVYERVLRQIITIQTHEAREFLRIAPDWVAPFHPHKVYGMQRWGDVKGDLDYNAV